MLRQDALRVSGQADETGSNRLTSEEVSYIGSGRATSNFELQISDFRWRRDQKEIRRQDAGGMKSESVISDKADGRGG
jgi:hypothetical protein